MGLLVAIPLTLFADILRESVVACTIAVVSARDHDLLQATWLAAAGSKDYVSIDHVIIVLFLVVTGPACSAVCVVSRSAHNAGKLAPSVSGCGMIEQDLCC